MAASAQEKFDAAVKVIRGLPKHGSFQPSHELMLKFYAYYKQATEGPCSAPKPSIWQVVNKRKWEAWTELGQMPKEQAMLLYVEELKNVSKHVKDTLYRPEIVETMPQTEEVAEFVQTLGTFYELVEEGSTADSIKKGKCQNGSTAFKGAGEHDMNHSQVMVGMLDSAKGTRRPDNSPDLVASYRNALNGVSESRDESGSEEEDVEEEEEEGEGVEEDTACRLKDSGHIDSGSDTDEFCDTSDQLMQLSVKTVAPVGCQPSVETSTPVTAKREIRVRFASHPHDCEDKGRHIDGLNNEDGHLQAVPPSSEQMLSDRLTLGSVAALAYGPHDSIIPSRSVTDSLYVHGSSSSLVSLAGDSVAGDASIVSTDLQGNNIDEDFESGFDGRSISFDTSLASRDQVKTRGGGEEEVPSGRRSRVTYTAGVGGSWNPGSSQQAGRGDRRGLFPGGSGSGGQRPSEGGAQQVSSLLDEQVLVTLLRLQQDITDVLNRLGKLEVIVQEDQCKTQAKKSPISKWWPFNGLSKKTIFFLLVWPFIVNILINMFCRKRNRR